jgi:hypothetical protein
MRTVNDYTTPEGVKVSSTHTGVQTYHGERRLGDIAFVYAKDNGGTFTFLPPTITIEDEKFYVTGVQARDRVKIYFRPWSDEDVRDSFLDQDEPAPGVRPVDNTSCVVCAFEQANFSPVAVEVEYDRYPAAP